MRVSLSRQLHATIGALCLHVVLVKGHPCSTASFESIIGSLNRPGTTVVYATSIAEGDSSFDPSPEYPTNATNLPALCAVKLNVKSSDTTSYNLGIFLPDKAAWNGRLMTTGNGGFGGGINVPSTIPSVSENHG